MTEIAQRQRRARRRVLTDKMVAELPRKARPYFHPDPELPKHGVRVRPTGPGAYTAITRDPFGKQRWVKIGSTAEMQIAEAREIARAVIRRVEQGLAAFEPPKPKADSVAVVLAEWLKRHVDKNGLRSAAEYRRIVATYIAPAWGDRAFAELRRSDVARLLDFIEDEHGAAQADAVLSVLRNAGNWQRDRSDDYVPPFVGIRGRVAMQDRARDRVLSDDEIRAIWAACDQVGAFGAFVKLLLLSGQRADKVRTVRWSDIAADGTWTIRDREAGEGERQDFKLPQMALDIIRAQPRLARNPYVFAGNDGAARSFWHDHKRTLDKRGGVESWRLHDCRRTARSLMSRAGVQSEHADRVLGHAIGGVEGIYDRHAYTEEKADVLRRLAALIERIINPPGDNVVALHEAVS